MPNEGYIIIKSKDGQRHQKNFRQFYGEIDKGCAKPTFCYPKRKEDLQNDINRMERSIESGNVGPEHKMSYQLQLKGKQERMNQINESEENSKKLFKQDESAWIERRNKLKEEIAHGLPTREDVKKRHVNPHKIARMEKEGFGTKKLEYQVLSRLMGEDSNVSFLQRDSA